MLEEAIYFLMTENRLYSTLCRRKLSRVSMKTLAEKWNHRRNPSQATMQPRRDVDVYSFTERKPTMAVASKCSQRHQCKYSYNKYQNTTDFTSL